MTEQSKYIAACYCRLSKDDEKEGVSESILTQKIILSEFCNNNGFLIYDFYCDDGYTGTNFDRPEFKRMKNDIDQKNVNTVVVKDLSRFGRNYVGVATLVEEAFPEQDIRFIAISDNIDTKRESAELDLTFQFKNMFNQFYPADCSKKTKQALASKARKGEYVASFAPYGYKKSAKDKHVLEIDEPAAQVVRRIFSMAAYEGYGYNKIANILTGDNIPTPSAYSGHCPVTSKEWNLATVKKILFDEVYRGTTVFGRRKKLSFKSNKVRKQSRENWISAENMHEAIISEGLWNDAQAKLSTRKRECRNGETNLFAGLVKCDTCGYALSLSSSKDRGKYFCCNTYKKKGAKACSIHYIQIKELEKLVLSDIRKQIRLVNTDEKEFVNRLKRKLNAEGTSETKRAESEILATERRIAELDRKFESLYEDKLSGILSVEKFKELSTKCESEQNVLKKLLERLRQKNENILDKEEQIDRFMEQLHMYSDIKELDKEILNRLIDKITVSDRYQKDGKTYQNVKIDYRFVNCMDL